ncbi:MAG: hypothetical protein AAFV29_04155 [Myxococcota bacterium]
MSGNKLVGQGFITGRFPPRLPTPTGPTHLDPDGPIQAALAHLGLPADDLKSAKIKVVRRDGDVFVNLSGKTADGRFTARLDGDKLDDALNLGRLDPARPPGIDLADLSKLEDLVDLESAVLPSPDADALRLISGLEVVEFKSKGLRAKVESDGDTIAVTQRSGKGGAIKLRYALPRGEDGLPPIEDGELDTEALKLTNIRIQPKNFGDLRRNLLPELKRLGLGDIQLKRNGEVSAGGRAKLTRAQGQMLLDAATHLAIADGRRSSTEVEHALQSLESFDRDEAQARLIQSLGVSARNARLLAEAHFLSQ